MTGDTAIPDASAERVTRKLTFKAGSSSEIGSERGASTHPFDPGTVFPLKVCYHNNSWLQHGSSSNSNSNSSNSSSSNISSNSSSSNSSNSNDTTSTHDSWWDITCVGALLRPFDPGKRCRRSARIGKAALGLDFPFDRGKAWRRMQHGGWRLRAEGEFLVLFAFCREQLENRVLETALVSLCSTRENHEGAEYDVIVCGHVSLFFRMMPFSLCENQSSLVLT